MVSFLRSIPQAPYGQQWAFLFGLATFTWFAVICFARLLPAPLQLLSALIPILLYTHALHILPKWQKQGRRSDLAESLIEREIDHKMLRQHHLNVSTIDLDFNQTMQALHEMYPDATIVEEENQAIGATPHAQLSLPDQAAQAINLQQQVQQIAGETGWKLVTYLTGKGAQYCDRDGWFSIERLRVNWGRNNNLNKQQLTELLSLLTQHQVGEWRDSSLSEWRLLLTP